MTSDAPYHVIFVDIDSLFPPAPEKVYRETIPRVPRGSKLRFVVKSGSDKLLHKPILFTNYPPQSAKNFDRYFYYECKGSHYNGKDDFTIDIHSGEEINRPGCFEYYFQYYVESKGITTTMKGHARTFNVEPILNLKNTIIPQDGIVLQTVVPKFLGDENRVKEICKEASDCGYNMIHFTPIQELGQSNSAYSLYDQLSVSSSFFGKDLPFEERVQKMRELLGILENDYKLLSMVDIVFNHTANNTPWLSEHPEAGYNLDNCPHLRVAYELDEALVKFSRDIVDSKYPEIFPYVGSDDDVRKILDVFKRRVWPGLRMWEYFIVDVKESIDEFKAALMQNKPIAPKYSALPKSRYFEVLKSDGLYNSGSGKRFGYKIKLDTALALFNFPTVNPISANEISSRCNNFREAINAINLPIYKQVDEDLETIIRNLFHRMRRGKLSYDEPLFDSYFTRVIKKETNEIVPLANNGWIWAGNPLIDFASDKSKAYYLREVIIWGDSVKLHYGHSREDNPWLWDHIQKYTELMASLFHGFRIDNAHSTPIHLAQYMLDAARRVRPELYVTAELFTGSPDLDGFWVGQLGINSLIREAIMAYDSWDLGRYVHRYGGKPVASVIWNKPGILAGVPVEMTPPPALFFDCTHDNETPNQKRTAQDALSTAGLVCMTVAAVGSTKGYDEIVPHNINIVQEKRLYKFPSKDVAIAPVKRVLNKLHLEMAQRGFAEVYVHQVENLITVQRHNPYTHEAIFLSAFCAFSHNVHPLSEFASVMKIPGKVTNIIVAARVNVRGHDFREDPSFISGIPTELTMKVNECGDFCELKESIDNGALITEVHLKNFPPGSILSFKTSLFSEQQKSLDGLHSHLKNEGWLFDIIEKLDLIDLNFLLFRCEEEEKAFAGLGSYEVPFFGKFNYCGIASLFYVLQIIRQHNDMGHSVFNNLRAGNWLLDYVSGRLKHYPKLQEIANWFTLYFEHLKGLPRHLIPKYFDIAITRVYQVAQKRAISQFSNFVKSSNNQFIQSLAMTSVQLYGIPEKNAPPNLAAGLPHFSNGYMRAWGRDTFISLRGLLLVVGRFEEAKSLIIGFARCLRHGLIPNLYDGGKSPRYNARDATWFFLQSIQDYCSLAPEKTEILKSKVPRLFPVDTQIEYEKSESVYRVDTLADIIQEIMQKHANGIHFREWNAGPNIDAHMKSEGFNVDITFEKATGFIYGGNSNNCGTWMDKMGESESAKNKGKPATPRDGAAIEIIGLLKSALRWLTALSSSGEFPHTGVKIEQTGENFKYKEWNNILQTSFESHFWIPTNSDDDFFFNINPPLVNRRSIYRDTYRTSESWGDYQLRPNQCIAMAVAPELFDPVHARQALHVIEHVLLGPLGMKTLDPKDWNYRPNYDMSLDGDYNTAKGFNYHQGPEWLWLLGYFLIAKIVFDNSEKTSPVTTFHQITKILKPHMKHIEESNWRGLPELTNENGSECSFSCPTQAWSMASILDAIFEMTKVTRS